MKKQILLFTACAGLGVLSLSSYETGPAAGGEGNRTPSGTNPTCSGASCHGTNDNASTVQLQLLPVGAGAPVSPGQAYTPSTVYQVVLSGTNVTLPATGKFGFQVTATNSLGANSGAFTIVGSKVHQVPVSGVNVVEHGTPLGAGSTFTTASSDNSFQWVAPGPGAGDVTFSVIVNAVNGNGVADPGDHATTAVYTFPAPTSVSELSQNIRITAYPNPANDRFSLKFEDADKGQYDVAVMDLNGRIVNRQSLNVNSNTASMTFESANWATGVYLVRIMKDGAQRVITLNKN